MPSKRIAIHNFDQRLVLSGGRDQIGDSSLRRAVGIAPELTRSVQSRWGSTFLYPISGISVFQFAGVRYSYDGVNLYANGVIVTYGDGSAIVWNGGKLTFNVMPPQEGLPDYLFINGGGNVIKIAPALVGGQPVPNAQKVTQWGINAPPDGMTASLGLQQQTVIDQMDTTASNWETSGTGSNVNCTVTNSTTNPYAGTADMKLALSGSGPTHITRLYSTSLATYPGPVISLPTDIISFWFKCPKPAKIGWLWLTFNVGDTTNLLSSPYTLKDYYRLVVQIVQNTNQKNAAGAQVIVTPSTDQWIQIAAPKSAFMRIGNNLNLDWSDVNGVRFNIGDLGDSTATSCELDQLTMFGGYALGAGPAALLGGSEYQYYVTFGNNTTGSDSNPNGMQLLADGTTAQPNPAVVGGVALQEVNLNNIPVSSDTQVGNRKLWRTTAGGAIPFFVATIPDNTTTTFADFYGDAPGQPIIQTPWTKSVSYAIGDYVDGGNGYYFVVTTGGTSGATIPQWNIPTGAFLGFWSPITQYLVGNWVSFNGTGYVCIANAFGPTQLPTNAAFWTALGTTTDNTVVWTWGGLNEVPHLGSDQLLLDNAPPQTTYGDAVGPYQGSMFWCRDSVPGRRGWTYSSPPGRPESVANQFAPTSDDDPTQKQIIFDYTLWLITTKIAFQTDGQNPQIEYFPIMYATGTTNPFSAVAGQDGVYYQASDGVRVINRNGSFLPGFEQLDTILRGQFSENVQPFVATIGAYCRNEIIFSNGVVSFGLSRGGQGYVWRMIGLGINALYYERNSNEILSSFYGQTMLLEDFGVVVDQTAVPLTVFGTMFEMQTPSQLPDEGQVVVIRRLFIDINCQVEPQFPAQEVGVILLADNLEISLGNITNNARSTIELAYQQPARQFSVRLLGCLSNRIEVFGIETDVALTGSDVTAYSGYVDKQIES